MKAETEARRIDIRYYESLVMMYLDSHKYLEIWSSIGAGGLLARGRVRATRHGLTKCKKHERTANSR
jgi:hypothetical protein